jgi:zinc protease
MQLGLLVVGVSLVIAALALLFLKSKKGRTTAVRERAQRDVADLAPHDTVTIDRESVKKIVLENGMTILACKQGKAPKVLVQIAYNVGSAIEESGERGLAHLLEHMIFKGTEKLAEGDIDSIARKYGADFNAFTSYDMTSYYFEMDNQNWQHFVPVLADCMKNARFDDQHLASEVKAVIQELRMYRDSHWHVMIEHAFKNLFPANHPYHHPIIGYKEDLADLSGARLRSFYDKYYHPSRAVLCIVGDIDLDEVTTLAQKTFEGIENAAADHTPDFVPLSNSLVTHSSTIYRDVQEEQLGLYWRIPGLREGNHLVVSATEYILGGGLDSRLYRLLVDELKIASGVRVGSEQMEASGVFVITVEPKEGQREACREAVVGQIEQLMSDGGSDIELYKMVKNRQRQHMLALNNLNDFTYQWIETFFMTGNEYALFDEANEYASITADQVKGFVASWLNPRDMHQMLLAPIPADARAIWQEEQAKEEAYYEFLLDRHKRTEPLGEPQYVHSLPDPKPVAFTFPQPTHVMRHASSNLTMITYTDSQVPLVSTALMFKDAAYIARSLDGVGVDVMMAMLLEGSQSLGKQDIVEGFDLHGAQYAYTGRGMSMTCSRASFASVFVHAMDILKSPSFDEAAFAKVKEIFIHSYTQKKDSAQQIAMRALKQAIYYKHPYGWSFDDALEYLKNLTIDDIKKLHDRYVNPAFMVLSVAGDIEPGYVEHLASQVTAGWQAGYYTAPVYPDTVMPEKTEVIIPLLRDQVVFACGRRADASLYEPAHLMLDVMSSICFHSLGSRLFELREKTGLFYTASGAWGADIHQEQGFDYVCAIVNPENLSFTKEAIAELVDACAKGTFTDAELAAARQMYVKELLDATTDIRSIAALFANIETLDIGFDYYDKALAYVRDLSVNTLNAYAREYISQERMVSVAVGRLEEKANS